MFFFGFEVKATFNSGGTIYVAADLNGDGIIDEEEEAALVKQYQALGQVPPAVNNSLQLTLLLL